MASVSRPFGYNNTGLPISGTTPYDDLVVGDIQTDYGANYGGIQWWGGPEESELLGYVIGNVRPGGQPVPPGVVGTGTVGFWRSKFHTDESFLNLANYIGAKNGQPTFTTTTEAENWLQSNGYYTSFNLPTPTPTATSQSTPTPTPTVTNTQTPTQTGTVTPTPSITASQTQTPTPSFTPTNTQTPTVTPTLTKTPTNTPSVTPTKPLVVRTLILGDSSSNTVGSFLSSYITSTGYSMTYSAVTIGTSYTGDGGITKANYDVVLIYTNGSQTGTQTMANALTTFVGEGGSVVSGVFLWNLYPSGYNFTGTTAFNFTNSQGTSVGNFTVVTPSPITNGIGTSLPSSFSNNNPTLVSGAVQLATFTNGDNCLAVKSIGSSRNVSINAFPVNINSSTSTICKMFGNAILYAAGRI